MKIKRLTPMLYTQQLQATIDFYTKVLGFGGKEYRTEPGWTILTMNETEIMFPCQMPICLLKNHIARVRFTLK